MSREDNGVQRSPYYGYGGQISRYGDQPQRGGRVEVQDMKRTNTAPVYLGYQYRAQVPVSRREPEKTVVRVLSMTEVQRRVDAQKAPNINKEWQNRPGFPGRYKNRDITNRSGVAQRETFSEREEQAFGSQLWEYSVTTSEAPKFSYIRVSTDGMRLPLRRKRASSDVKKINLDLFVQLPQVHRKRYKESCITRLGTTTGLFAHRWSRSKNYWIEDELLFDM